MAGRTIAVGDIHGCVTALRELLALLPALDASDTLLFVGDYVDRGPESRGVMDLVLGLEHQLDAKIVRLRGNHEDAWLRIADGEWRDCIEDYLAWPTNGCLATLRSYTGGAEPALAQHATTDELLAMESARFFPAAHLEGLRTLVDWYEDDHALYVHAGLAKGPRGFLAPGVTPSVAMSSAGPHVSPVLWEPSRSFYTEYSGKLVVFGHAAVARLPRATPELPNDPSTVWQRGSCIGLDTGAGWGGVLSAVELPARRVYQAPSGAHR